MGPDVALWPLLVFGGFAVLLVAAMLLLAYFLGEQHQHAEKDEPYESGISTTDKARMRFTSQFYLVAMLFVIFDLEAVFVFAWAIAWEQAGWIGYAGMAAFLIMLGVVLVYEWRTGALDFGPDNRKILKNYRKYVRQYNKEKAQQL